MAWKINPHQRQMSCTHIKCTPTTDKEFKTMFASSCCDSVQSFIYVLYVHTHIDVHGDSCEEHTNS